MRQKMLDLLYPGDDNARHSFAETGYIAHYTSATCAMSILENDEIWLTNVGGMNDFSEVRFARFAIEHILRNGGAFSTTLDSNWPRLLSALRKVSQRLRNPEVLTGFIANSYITCFAAEQAHGQDEHYIEQHGRLSMWRGCLRG